MEGADLKARRARLGLAVIGVLLLAVLAGGVVTASLLLDTGESTGSAKSEEKDRGSSHDEPSEEPRRPKLTPETGAKASLPKPKGQKDGVSTGFPHTTYGAYAAAVYFWEEYALLDDHKARQQLDAVVSPDAGSGYADEWISKVRKLREAAGLPPSGGTPAGVTFSTSVNALNAWTVDDKGDVIQVWLNYDRFATKADGEPDPAPLKDRTDNVILKWQNGGWKLTDERKYRKEGGRPVSYNPDARVAWQNGWRQVRHD
ncbi:hypothetical protein [Streptomyces sp. NPDC048636]|uniref:hypothetical protein n=1 Tax=Streptomyces sp. NPDC048636 TaxID=3155762 RepID=UPI003420CC17